MIQVKAYSPKGIVVKGATADQAEAIRAQLGAAVVTSHNARLGGWIFSRKREDRIRSIVAAMQGGDAPAPQAAPEHLDGDDMPGEWLGVVLGQGGAASDGQSPA